MKKTAVLVIMCLIVSLLAACGRVEAPPVDGDLNANPFDYEAPPDVLGSVSHAPDTQDPLEYTGGELRVPYLATGEGTGRSVGFLLFLDGIPQPYRLNGEGEYAYMHPFTLGEDNTEEHFSFAFVPVTGRAGDTVTLTVADLFNAGFEPDMVSSSSFGLYGDAVTGSYPISFSADPEPDAPEGKTLAALSGVSVKNELMTARFVEENLGPQIGMSTGDGKTREDKLDENVYVFDTFDGKEELNDIEITGRDTLHIAVDICGIPGLTYRVSFFADNTPLTDGEDIFREVTLEKGKTARVEADLTRAELPEAVTTYYAAVCAVGGEKDDIRGFQLIKTRSVPIWDGDRLDRDGASPDDRDGSGGNAGTVLASPEAMDSAVRSLWYGEGGTVLVRRSDGLCLVDMSSGEILAEGPDPGLKSVTFHPIAGGFCAVGEAEENGGTAALTPDGSGATGTVCVFLDSSLSELDRFSLSAVAGGDKNIMCAAVSPDGRYAAFSVMNDGIYLYDRETRKVTLPLDFRGGSDGNGGVTMATGLWFSEDSSKLIFSDNTHFGSVGLDGEGLACAGFDGFDPQGPVGYAGGKMLFNESFFTASGAMAVADVDSLAYAVYTHSAPEGAGDLFVSRDGEYFATAAFDGSLTVRVYGTRDDSLRLEYTVTDENEDAFDAAPGILILDDLKLCVVKTGGFSDVPARVTVLSFD